MSVVLNVSRATIGPVTGGQVSRMLEKDGLSCAEPLGGKVCTFVESALLPFEALGASRTERFQLSLQ